jgi:CRP/FNR family transcriptional regulator, anaerobic regulatory protein
MLGAFDKLAYVQRHVRSGGPLFCAGDPFASLYGVQAGFFKTSMVDGDGRWQVTGFFMAGDLLGLDGIGSGQYEQTASALEDSVVAVMPYPRAETLARESPGSSCDLHVALAREIAREHRLMLLLGSAHAEQRLAAFLLNLSDRFRRRGYSPSDFHLRMTRADIGSYLGLKIETVSRLFSRLHDHGILEVRQKHVRLIDAERLAAMAAAA